MAEVYDHVGSVVARHPEVQKMLRNRAEDFARRVKSIAGMRSRSGTYAASIKGPSRLGSRHDLWIYTTDPLAVTKEYGRTGARGVGGPSRGVHAFTKALAGEG